MARHGENIRKRKDGRWEGRYALYDPGKGKKRCHSVYGRSYQEAKEKLAERKSRLPECGERSAGEITGERRGTQPEAEKILLSDAAGQWLGEVKAKKKPATYIKYSLIYQKHLQPAFQRVPLSQITDSFVRERISDHLSVSMQKSIYCVLNQILKFASRKYSASIPVLKRPEGYAPKKPVQVFTRKEQARLLPSLYQETDCFKSAVLLCLYTGLRLGELCALRWEDIDFENQVIMVSRTVQRLYAEGQQTKTALLETPPKSVHAIREIPVPAAALVVLGRLKKEKEYVFGGSKALEPRTMQNHFRKILKESGIEYKNFHTLRHTFSTNCIEGGTDVKSLSEMLGHSDVQVTLNRYVHPSMDTKRRYLDELAVFYQRIQGQVYGQANRG